MSDKPIIVLFHRDLRVMDHPALSAACDTGAPVIALYICDEAAAGDFTIGGASKWWLHHSLARLSEKLDALGGSLTLRRGDTVSILKEITDAHNVGGIYFKILTVSPRRSVSEPPQVPVSQRVGLRLVTQARDLLWCRYRGADTAV
ncbi:MAG: deoxyribodipyrimidine photo-lyase, partial [Pseudomonadota bacterium]